ncbi:MAG: hypothetical protein R3B98_06845 [Hyphomonas sp.]
MATEANSSMAMSTGTFLMRLPDRPLILWHYSGHDFYLNSAALAARRS